MFEAPHILHRDNGQEFANNVTEEVCSMWDKLKIVHGKPRHSESQAKVGFKTPLSAITLSEIRSEEDLEAILADQSNDALNEVNVNSTTEDSYCCQWKNNASIGVEENEGDEEDGTAIDKALKKIQEIRDFAKQSLVKQTDRMLKLSNDRFPFEKVGQSVRVRISEVDRAKADRRNIIAINISVKDEGLYKLGTKHVNEVPDIEISPSECVRKPSNLGGQ
ncbi:uncharacterized protein [Diabrotica undecimpunctata]|uniref:uncharacterized protein n=1 Tax=Diabrotica undecimpunctata TaxID=50387 RepID=UPI003B6419DF